MLDIKRIRNDFDSIAEKLVSRGVSQDTLQELKDLDTKRRSLLVQSEEAKAERNTASAAIAQAKRNKEDVSAQIAAMQKLSTQIKTIDAELAEIDEKLKAVITVLPNTPHESVPVGADEDENVEVRRWGTPRDFTFDIKAHWDLGEDLDILDWERGAKVTGSRFLFYKGLGARLERAIYNFMLDEHAKEGYTEVIPPYMVNHESMFGTGQYPKFKEDTFELADTDYVLIPTAEVPLTNYYRDEIIDGKDLPIYFTAMSPSFRSEAGSAGRDTRGLIRLHQFHKVEMVKFAKPEESYDELEKMVVNAQNILQKLELPYRVITLCTGDMGFSAAKTYDLEVWIPAQNTYREISSCSNTEDFQARRAQVSYLMKKQDIKVILPHSQLSTFQIIKKNWTALLIFLGAIIPILLTIGPLSQFLSDHGMAKALESISLLTWIPTLMIALCLILGWQQLKDKVLNINYCAEHLFLQFKTIGGVLLFAFAASEVLANLGLEKGLIQIFTMFNLPKALMVLLIATLVVLVAGPLSSTATLTSIGLIAFTGLTSAGVPPLLAVVSILVFASTEGASPPASGSIFIASSLAQVEPEKTFYPLIIYFVIPILIIGWLIAMGILPLFV